MPTQSERDSLLTDLARAWADNPHWRFGQLVVNAVAFWDPEVDDDRLTGLFHCPDSSFRFDHWFS